jgi:RimJ/RimL family protein N-acetyltransferase
MSAIRAATEYAVGTLKISRVLARVKAGNTASIRAFGAAGFTPTETGGDAGTESIELEWRA